MAKLYPPYIEGTIPAFTGTTIVVPFSLNRANSISDIAGFSLRIKTVQNNIMLATLTQKDSQYYDIYADFKVSFTLEEDLINLLNVGQFYKVQLAFINKSNEVGYYSTVGVIKYTTSPEVSIANLKRQDNLNVISTINRHIYNYVGVYSQHNKDTTEKIYSSRFILTDANNEIIVDSGDLIHNSSKDINSYESSESYTISRELEDNKSYYIKYIVTTINGLIVESPTYRLMQQNPVHPDLQAEVTAAVNFEEGYIDVGLVGIVNKKGNEIPATGSFILSRAASNTNWTWQNITYFTLQAQRPTRFLWRDFTVEQGVQYQYAVQQYSDNQLYSQRIKSPIVTADFEDSFLYDGYRQLKIRFNPKVSSFKNNIPEQKIDTIGSKYPFIFRNGRVYYKEFPISGLISYQSDENKLFYPIKPREDLESHPYDITSEDIYNEREFKLEVLEWLNNGELKVFKSPTEGNYFVRLMNVSLTPQDALGRMLHTFNCTAYEIYDYTYDNLVNQNFINVYINKESSLRFATIQLQSLDESLNNLLLSLDDYVNAGVNINFTKQQYARICNYSYYINDNENTPKFDYTSLFVANGDNYYIPAQVLKTDNNLNVLKNIINKVTYVTGAINNYPVYSIFIQDMKPGTKVNLIIDSEKTETIQISSRGSYIANFDTPILGVEVPKFYDVVDSEGHIIDSKPNVVLNNKGDIVENQGSITYGYYSSWTNVFNTISEAITVDVPIQQFIGLPSKTYYSINDESTITTHNLIEVIENIKKNIIQIFSLNFYLRPIVKIYFQDNRIKNFTKANLKNQSFYWDMNCTQKIKNLNNLYPNYLYAICRARYDYTFQEDVLFEQAFIDATTGYEYFTETFDKYNGFYVDTFDNRVKVFTGFYLDGKSTNEDVYIIDKNTCTRQIQINEDIIDLTNKEKYSLNSDFNSTIKKIYFDDGIMCDISYQYSDITYSMEEYNDLIKSQKNYYETVYNAWIELHESSTVISYNSIPGYNNIKDYNPNTTLGLSAFVAYESNVNQLIKTINTLYQKYIDYLTICLKQYREEHEML